MTSLLEYDDEFIDTVQYAMLAEDWRAKSRDNRGRTLGSGR